MGRILGLDLGTNSIGWAVVDADINDDGKVAQYNSVTDCGVRIFPMGIDPDTLGQGEREKSKNAERRENRQKRRQFYRKRLRKIKLLELLISLEMCPLSDDELKQWKYWDKNKKSGGKKFPDSQDFVEWLKLDPYLLRKKAIHENVSLHELGRILYHMIQRRGFVSSRKEKEKGAIFEGKDDKTGIEETRRKMGNRTLGEYLCTIIPKEGEPYRTYRDSDGKILRARSRYTLRDMYIEEFYHIWDRQAKQLGVDGISVVQKKTRILDGSLRSKRNREKIEKLGKKYGKKNIHIEGNKIISEEEVPLQKYLAGEIWMKNEEIQHRDTENSVLFWQRPLRSQKSLLGKCRFEHQYMNINGKKIETGKSPCYLSHPEFELYRTYQFVNNIEFGTKQKLNEEQRQKVIDLINSRKSNFKFKVIVKKLKMTAERFNYDDDFTVAGNQTIAQLKPLFDKTVWENNYHAIWHCFHFYSDNEKLFEKLKKSYHCKCDSAEDIENISLKDGYAGLSLKAIRNINPFLKKGYPLSLSIVLGGVKNAFGSEKWESFREYHSKIENDIRYLTVQRNAEGELISKIKDYLTKGFAEIDFGFEPNDKRFKKLYHPSVEVQKSDVHLKKKIPPIPDLRNPLVQRALTETRHLVNALMDRYGAFDITRIEMGRDLKNSKTARRKMSFRISENRKKNEAARERLTEYGLAHSRRNIRKYLLFKEIEEHSGRVACPYTGKTIRINDLLGTGNLFQIEHIIPFSISLDDSFGNITLCESNFNRDKGERTPYEFYKKNPDPDIWGGMHSWEEIEFRTFKILPYNKAKRFTSKKSFEADTFISRQLNDMRYISRESVNIMKEVCPDVQVLPGSLTSELRYLWGLNNVLQPIHEIDVSKGELDARENMRIPHWALVKDNDHFVSIHRKHNIKPELPKNYCLFPGKVKKGVFRSEFYKDVTAGDLDTGAYWYKTPITGKPDFYRVYNKKPEANSRYIVLKGRIEGEKFTNERLNRNVKVIDMSRGSYWGCFDVEKVEFTGNERPKPKSGQIALWGKVNDSRFISYNYQCPCEQADGNTWALLSLNTEDVTFTKIYRGMPEQKENEVLMQGTIDNDGVWIADDNPDQAYATALPPGKYWVLFGVSEEHEFIPVENPAPKVSSGEKVIEGDIWIDKQGEVRFEPKKNRDDQRHHAVDAVTIACTERAFLQKLSTYHAKQRERNDGYSPLRPEFDTPWPDFRNSVQQAVSGILTSYYKDNRVLDKSYKYVYKNGKKYYAQVSSVRGQLHKDTVFGKRTAPDGRTAFHIRKPITALQSKTHVQKIVDKTLRKIIEDHLRDNCNVDISNKKYTVPNDAFFKDGEYRIKLPNKNGEPVPVKKVRMREEVNNAKQLKTNINQFVNPRSNNHIIIYINKRGDIDRNIVTFWEAIQRINSDESIYQLPEDGKEIITIMEKDDMYLLGIDNKTNLEEISNKILSEHLFKVQKVAGGSYFMELCFKHHLDSRKDKEAKGDYIFIKGFGNGTTGWHSYTPKKVRIDILGNIKHYRKC